MEFKLMNDALDLTYKALERKEVARLVELTTEEVRWEKTMANKWKHQDQWIGGRI